MDKILKKQYDMIYRQNNRERKRIVEQKYKIENKEKIREAEKLRYQKNKDAICSRNMRNYYKRKYGITKEQYDAMVLQQGGLCAICRKPETSLDSRTSSSVIGLAIDHCHTTGRIRKLLCKRCNMCLGRVGDSVEVLQAMIKYLEEHNA